MIDVQRVDYIRIPVTDMEKANQFYGEVLGLKRHPNSPGEDWVEYEAGNVTLAVMTPHTHDYEFTPLPVGTLALRVPDVAAAKAKLEAAGVQVNEMWDSGVVMAPGSAIRRETPSSSTTATPPSAWLTAHSVGRSGPSIVRANRRRHRGGVRQCRTLICPRVCRGSEARCSFARRPQCISTLSLRSCCGPTTRCREATVELIAADVFSRNKTVFCEHLAQRLRRRPARRRNRTGRGGQARPGRRGDRAQASRTPAHCRQGCGRWQERHKLRHRSSAGPATRHPSRESHDTVLIAAAFCMYNRDVDGLDTWQPSDPQAYRERAHLLVEQGYARSVPASD